jgi:hypothetical protein
MKYGSGPPVPFPIWIWIFLAAILVGVPVLVIGVALLLRGRAARSAARRAGGPGQAARTHARRITRSGLAGLGVGAVLGVALILGARADLAPLSCAGGYLAGLLMGEYAAQPPAAGHVRVATLRARQPADYAPRWAAVIAVLAGGFSIATVIAYAVVPPISYGAWQPVTGAGFTLPGGKTAWPGWPATVAAALGACAILLLGAAGLRRVAARPQLTDGGDLELDELLRRQAGRAITGAVLGLELIVLAALMIAGSEGLAVPVPAISGAAYAGSEAMVDAGLCCGIGGLVSWLALSGWTRRARRGGGHEPRSAAQAEG